MNKSNVIIMEHPSSLLRGPSLTITNVSIVIGRYTLLCSTTEHADYAKTNRGDGECWAPAIIQNVEADMAIGINMGMARGRGQKHDFWSFHGIVGRENKTQDILLVLIDTTSSAGNGDEPFVYPIGLGDGHSGDGWTFHGPLGEFAGEAALCYAG